MTWEYDGGGNITCRREYAYTTSAALGTAVKTVNYGYGNSQWKDKLTSFNGQAITYDGAGNPLSYRNATLTWQGRLPITYKANGWNWALTNTYDGEVILKRRLLMKKAVLLMLLILLSLLVFVGCELTKEFTYDNVKYYVINDSLSLLGFDKDRGTTDLYITEPPSKIEFKRFCIIPNAFENNEDLRSLTITSDIFGYICKAAFRNCTNLKNVKLADSTKYLAEESFYGCAIEKIDLPEAMVAIDEKAFAQCSLLNEIRIGSKIELIRKDAFAGCAEDLKVYITAVQPPELEGDIFGGNESVTVYVPEEAVTAYKENEYWQAYEANIIPIPAE